MHDLFICKLVQGGVKERIIKDTKVPYVEFRNAGDDVVTVRFIVNDEVYLYGFSKANEFFYYFDEFDSMAPGQYIISDHAYYCTTPVERRSRKDIIDCTDFFSQLICKNEYDYEFFPTYKDVSYLHYQLSMSNEIRNREILGYFTERVDYHYFYEIKDFLEKNKFERPDITKKHFIRRLNDGSAIEVKCEPKGGNCMMVESDKLIFRVRYPFYKQRFAIFNQKWLNL